jgi:general secretion pathway protein A
VTEPESPLFLTEPETAVVEPPAPIPEPVVLHFDPVFEEPERFTTPEPSSTADPELPVIASAPEESSDVPEPGLDPKLDPKLNPGLEPEPEPEPLPIMEPALPSFASASNEPEELEIAEPEEPPAVPEPELPLQASAADESEVIEVPEPTPVWEPDESSLEAEPQNFVTYFKLDQDPFLLTPDTSFFYPSPEHNEAIANLSYGIQGRRGFLALTGESGSGKTMVLECVMLKLERQRVDFAYLSHSNITTDEFFGLLNYDLDLRCPAPTKVKVLVALNERLIENLRDGRITVLFVDNAHKLSVDVIEEIELIGNMETRRSKLIQVVFSGQPDFDEVLDHPRLRGLRQRILARCRIEPLSARHTAEYIEARLSRAGLANQKVFSEDVLAAIHQSTGGRPRFINAVCGALLEACMERRTRTADLGLLEYVTSEMELDRPFG